jgi:hypothetical protein
MQSVWIPETMMHGKKGQLEPVISGVVGLVILSIFSVLVFNIVDAFTKDKCAPYIQQTETCKSDLQHLGSEKQQLEHQLNISEEKYINLTNTNITKEDILKILDELNRTKIEVNYVKSELVNVNNNVISNFNALVFNFKWSLAINFTLLSLAFIDIALLAFGIDIKSSIIHKIKKATSKLFRSNQSEEHKEHK